jgi:hypothetical protein
MGNFKGTSKKEKNEHGDLLYMIGTICPSGAGNKLLPTVSRQKEWLPSR